MNPGWWSGLSTIILPSGGRRHAGARVRMHGTTALQTGSSPHGTAARFIQDRRLRCRTMVLIFRRVDT
jgi:hypothetical protein